MKNDETYLFGRTRISDTHSKIMLKFFHLLIHIMIPEKQLSSPHPHPQMFPEMFVGCFQLPEFQDQVNTIFALSPQRVASGQIRRLAYAFD